jgi:hypothetical protein
VPAAAAAATAAAAASSAARASWGADLVGLHARMLRSDRKWYHVLVEDFEPREALHLLRFFSSGAPTPSRAYYSLRDADRRLRWHDERGQLMAEGQPPRAAAKGIAPAPPAAGAAESRRSSTDAAAGSGGGDGGGGGSGGGGSGSGGPGRPLPTIPIVAVRTNVLGRDAGADSGGGGGASGGTSSDRAPSSLAPLPSPPPPPSVAASAAPSSLASSSGSLTSSRRAIFRQPDGSLFAYASSGAAVRVFLPAASNRLLPAPLQPPAGGWSALQARADDPQKLLFRRVRIFWPLVSARDRALCS